MKDLVKEYISDLGNNPLCTTLNKGKIRLSEILSDFISYHDDSQKSSVIDGIISESVKGKPSRLGNVEAIETDEGMIVVESKRTASVITS